MPLRMEAMPLSPVFGAGVSPAKMCTLPAVPALHHKIGTNELATVRGRDVFIPMDFVVGGEARVGFGWNMLMECLGEGRGISLPASAGGICQTACNAVGGYARIS